MSDNEGDSLERIIPGVLAEFRETRFGAGLPIVGNL